MAFAHIILRTADGAEYGPITREVLGQWSAEGRVPLDATLVDAETGEVRPVSALLTRSEFAEGDTPTVESPSPASPDATPVPELVFAASAGTPLPRGAGETEVFDTPAPVPAQPIDMPVVTAPPAVDPAPDATPTVILEAPVDLHADMADMMVATPPINAEELLAVAPPHLPKRRGSKKAIVLIGSLVVVLGLAGAGYYLWSTGALPFLPSPPGMTATDPGTPAPATPEWTVAEKEQLGDTWVYTITTDQQDPTQLAAIAETLPTQDKLTLKTGETSDGVRLTVFFIPNGQTAKTATTYKSYLWDPGQAKWLWRVK